jgi:hypothetical protein
MHMGKEDGTKHRSAVPIELVFELSVPDLHFLSLARFFLYLHFEADDHTVVESLHNGW